MCTTASSPVLFCKKSRGTKRPWYRLFEKDTPVFPSAGALSIQQKFWCEISKIQRTQWNGWFRFHRPVPSHRVFALQAGYKRAVLGTTIFLNGKEIFSRTDRNEWIGQSEPPSKVVPNIPVGGNRNGPFHLISNQNLRIYGLNGKRLRNIGCNKFMMYEMSHQRSCVTVEIERSHWPRDLTPTYYLS